MSYPRDYYPYGFETEDPLTPFIFLQVADGLSGLILRTVKLVLYFEFWMGDSNLVVSHLRYTNDNLLEVDPSLENLWCLKAILIDF